MHYNYILEQENTIIKNEITVNPDGVKFVKAEIPDLKCFINYRVEDYNGRRVVIFVTLKAYDWDELMVCDTDYPDGYLDIISIILLSEKVSNFIWKGNNTISVYPVQDSNYYYDTSTNLPNTAYIVKHTLSENPLEVFSYNIGKMCYEIVPEEVYKHSVEQALRLKTSAGIDPTLLVRIGPASHTKYRQLKNNYELFKEVYND